MGATAEDVLAEMRCVQVINRYATAVDGVDIDLLRTCFTPDVEASYMGRAIEPGVEPIVATIAPLARMTGTVHNLGPVHASVDGDVATARAGCLVLAVNGDEPPRGVLRGVKYRFELVRHDGDWRIRRLWHDVLWATAAPRSGPTGEPLD
jgi:hypothetical protein